jgi:uncharacterized protein YbjT (DUF2867 family)
MILVIGGTGNVGGEVARQLVAAGESVRALVRDRAAAAQKLGSKIEIALGDLARPETLDAALRDIDRMYLLPPLVPNMVELEANAIDAAERAGIRHVVKHSNMGAQYEPGITLPRWHRAGEKLLERSKMSWTFVRPTGFMSNALGWAGTIKHQGVVYAPGGDGKLSLVDPRDIATVAVKALIEHGHENKAYEVTGPEALSTAEQVRKISEAIRKPIQYVDIPEQAARESMLKLGMPAVIVEGMLEFMALVRAGQGATVTDSVRQVTGTPPRTFDAWIRENVSAFA